MCPNCGFLNDSNTKFCIKCGNSINNVQSEQSNNISNNTNIVNSIENENSQNSIDQSILNNDINTQQPIINNNINQSTTNNSVLQQKTNSQPTSNEKNNLTVKQYLLTIFTFIMKPVTAFKEEISKFSTITNSIILSLIVSGIATISGLVNSILSVVVVKNYNWLTGELQSTEWVWDNLKKINFIESIGKNFIVYILAILLIATVYYLGCIAIKKETNYSKLVAIAAMSIVPFTVCLGLVSPILGLIYNPLSVVVSIASGIYTITLLHETINSEIKLEGNLKYYFNTVCYSVIASVLYFMVIKALTSTLSGLY